MKTECKHEFITITNLYGKVIQDYIRDGTIYRSLKICTKCGKRGMSTEVDKNCTIKNKTYLW